MTFARTIITRHLHLNKHKNNKCLCVTLTPYIVPEPKLPINNVSFRSTWHSIKTIQGPISAHHSRYIVPLNFAGPLTVTSFHSPLKWNKKYRHRLYLSFHRHIIPGVTLGGVTKGWKLVEVLSPVHDLPFSIMSFVDRNCANGFRPK